MGRGGDSQQSFYKRLRLWPDWSDRWPYTLLRESSFNMTRGGDEDIEGGAPKIFRHPKGGLWKNCCARRGGSENLYTSKPTHSSYRLDGFQLNNFMTCATQLYHVVHRYNKCSLSNYYTLVHPKNALENFNTTVSQVCHSINHWRQ